MQLINYLKLTFLISFFAVSCKNAPQKSVSSIDEKIFYLETTSCMGTCPVFTFTVLSNGVCSYNGTANVDKLGTYFGSLDSGQLADLKKELSNSNFFNIDLKNDSLIKDLPTTYLYYNNGSREKKISYYHPKNKTVDGLVGFSYNLIKSITWTKEN